MAQSFEEGLKSVEKSIEALESGKLTLEESLKTFEAGVGAIKECQNYLKASEQQVSILLGDNKDGTPVFGDFADDTEDEASS